MIFYRFPFEVNMVFFSEPRDIGIDNNFYPKNNVTKMIMISVLGEVRFGREDYFLQLCYPFSGQMTSVLF